MSSDPALDRPQILVLGTFATETALIPAPTPAQPDAASAIANDAHLTKSDSVGAPIIHEMIVRALLGPAERSQSTSWIHPADRAADLTGSGSAPDELTTVFSQFQQRSDGKRADKVWRVKTNYRARTKAFDACAYSDTVQQCITGCPTPDIVVIYEQDMHFQLALRQLATQSAVLPPTQGPKFLVVALANEVEDVSVRAAQRVFGRCHTIVVVTADALRRKGLKIVAYGSIEQTVGDLTRCLTTPPLAGILESCSHLVVLFEDSGAVCVSRGRKRLGSVHFCPNVDRVAHMEHDAFGRAPGRMAITLTAVTRLLYERLRASGTSALDLAPALRLSLVAHNRMFETGFDGGDPFETVKDAVSTERCEELRALIDPTDAKKQPNNHLIASSLAFRANVNELKSWSRLAAFGERGPEFLRTIVVKGIETASRINAVGAQGPGLWWPASRVSCPFMQVGKLKTFDRVEIERLADLAKLIRKYLDDSDWSTPLSIAVFGPPGAGKSFAVKQLMNAVAPGIKDTSILTFNLAQFDSLELLTEAFHQVQDQALTSDDVPLVIFDEFDASGIGSELGWLKYFLGPMEDGLFRGRTASYKVGRAVFLFAGGTAHSFNDFRNGIVLGAPSTQPASGPNASPGPASASESSIEAKMKAVKLPDFVSRLMAHLDVLGINRVQEQPRATALPEQEQEQEHEHERFRRRVRRAILLRSILVDCAKPILGPDGTARIREEVIAAFLHDDVRYSNEARSMKALVRGSRWIGGEFLPASLPSKRVIKMHTQGWPFDGPSS